MDTTPATPEAAEDSSASNWRSALEAEDGSFDESELGWYGQDSPIYSGEPTPAQTEAARRFVSHWLEADGHGFIIPGTEWGQSLKHWLNILVSRPAPGGDELPEYSPAIGSAATMEVGAALEAAQELERQGVSIEGGSFVEGAVWQQQRLLRSALAGGYRTDDQEGRR